MSFFGWKLKSPSWITPASWINRCLEHRYVSLFQRFPVLFLSAVRVREELELVWPGLIDYVKLFRWFHLASLLFILSNWTGVNLCLILKVIVIELAVILFLLAVFLRPFQPDPTNPITFTESRGLWANTCHVLCLYALGRLCAVLLGVPAPI